MFQGKLDVFGLSGTGILDVNHMSQWIRNPFEIDSGFLDPGEKKLYIYSLHSMAESHHRLKNIVENSGYDGAGSWNRVGSVPTCSYHPSRCGLVGGPVEPLGFFTEAFQLVERRPFRTKRWAQEATLGAEDEDWGGWVETRDAGGEDGFLERFCRRIVYIIYIYTELMEQHWHRLPRKSWIAFELLSRGR